MDTHFQHRPERILAKAFLIGIIVGTVLLLLPVSNRNNVWTDPLTALFTATSAVCVTGLTVVDTGSFLAVSANSLSLYHRKTGVIKSIEYNSVILM